VRELEPGERGHGHLEVTALPLAEEAIGIFSRHVEEDRMVWVVGGLRAGGFPAWRLLSLVRLHDFGGCRSW